MVKMVKNYREYLFDSNDAALKKAYSVYKATGFDASVFRMSKRGEKPFYVVVGPK